LTSAGRAAGLIFFVILLAGCPGRHGMKPTTRPEGVDVGLYRAELDDGTGKPRRFRLMLYAELPDRLHGEVLTPVGTTVMIVDAGGGRISVALTRDRRAYVGRSEPEVVESILGVRLAVDELVRALLSPEIETTTLEVRRSPDGPGLPESFEIGAPPRRFRLELKKRQRAVPTGTPLGTGEPPPGMDLLPLEELDVSVAKELEQAS